ncbi:MAG: four helix bundle protein [Thermosphaera sp.]
MNSTKKFDIKDRTLEFAIRIVKLIRKFPKDSAGMVLGTQLVRAGTSIGANMEEADGASTRKDFFNKVSIARKEARETRYWLKVVVGSELLNHPSNINEAKDLVEESTELVKILSSIISKK